MIVNAGNDQTVSARAVRRKLYREGCYSRAAVHKSLIIKMNVHLRVQWCKNQRQRYSQQVGQCMCGMHQDNGTGLNA